jgi:hypothetical protein
MSTTELRSGTIGDVEWSEDEDRDVLYDLARNQNVPTSGSDATKEELVVALLGASDQAPADEGDAEDQDAPAPEGEVEVESEAEGDAEAEDEDIEDEDAEAAAAAASRESVIANPGGTPGAKSPPAHAARGGATRTTQRPTGGARKVHGSSGAHKV